MPFWPFSHGSSRSLNVHSIDMYGRRLVGILQGWPGRFLNGIGSTELFIDLVSPWQS